MTEFEIPRIDPAIIEAGMRRGRKMRSDAVYEGLSAVWHWIEDHLPGHHHPTGGHAAHA